MATGVAIGLVGAWADPRRRGRARHRDLVARPAGGCRARPNRLWQVRSQVRHLHRPGPARRLQGALAADRAGGDPVTVNFVMVRVGDRYAPDYVAILADMIARNASNLESFAIWCVTDRPEELPEGVNAIPADPSIPPSWWAKCQLFSP